MIPILKSIISGYINYKYCSRTINISCSIYRKVMPSRNAATLYPSSMQITSPRD